MRKAMVVILLVTLLAGNLHASFLEKFSINAGYDYQSWDTDLDTMELVFTLDDYTDSEEITTEDIDLDNERNNYYNQIHNFGLDIGYVIIKGLSVNAGAGLAVIQLETREVIRSDTTEPYEEEIDNLMDTKIPGFYVKGGLDFRLPVYRMLYVSISPEVSYTLIRDMNVIDPDNDDIPTAYELQKMRLDQDVLAWQGSVLAGLDFGWVSPYVGGRYHAFRQHMAHDESFTAFGDMPLEHDWELYFKPSSVFVGLAGISFRIAKHVHLDLEGSLGKGFSITSKLRISL
jgi:hypothetical protein